MIMFSGINVNCVECNFIVSDYIIVQTFTNGSELPKTEVICRTCAIKRGLPVEYKGQPIKTIGLFVGE